MRRAHSSRASGLRSNKLHLRELRIFLFLLVEKTLSRSSVTNSFLLREKNPHRQLRRCLWGFQKGEDKYLTLSLVQSFHFHRKKEVGAFFFRIMVVLTVFPPLYNLL